MVIFIVTAAVVLALDLLTKYLISSGMELHSSITLIPGVLDLTYIENEGMAYGLLAGKQFLLQAFTIIVILVILGYVISKRNKLPGSERIAFALIVGGGLGNLISRFARGSVVDFIDFTFTSIFNIFNIADIGITAGCVLLIISMILQERSAKKDGRSVKD